MFISSMTSDVEHILTYPLVLSLSSLEECLIRSLSHFQWSYLWLFVIVIVLFDFFIYFGCYPLAAVWFSNPFFPFCRLSVHVVDSFSCCADAF